MKRLAILGASGHGKVVAETAELLGWSEVSFFDDAWPTVSHIEHWSVFGDSAALVDQLHAYDGVVVAIGDNETREEKTRFLVEHQAPLVSLIHPAAVISRFAEIGNGSVVFANVVVNAYATVGIASILNTACTVDHDCKIGDAVHISPGANIAGSVQIGSRSWVGIGACIKQGVQVAENVVIGAGGVVLRDVASRLTVVGNPAKPYGSK